MIGKKVLITGGAGFVGGRAAELLIQQGAIVDIWDDMRYWRDGKVVPRGIRKHITHSLCEIEFKEFDYDLVIHAATVNIIQAMSAMEECVETNFQSTVQFFKSLPAKTKVIYLSTASVYGQASVFPTPETAQVRPSNVYAMTKLLAEQFLASTELPFTILRLSNVYGPRQRPDNAYSGVMCKVIESALTSKELPIYGDGEDTRDFTYVDDVVSAILHVHNLPFLGHVYNVSTGVATSIMELVNKVNYILDVEIPLKPSPPRPIDIIDHRVLSSEKLQNTGWKPQVMLSAGIVKTVSWMQEEKIFSKSDILI